MKGRWYRASCHGLTQQQSRMQCASAVWEDIYKTWGYFYDKVVINPRDCLFVCGDSNPQVFRKSEHLYIQMQTMMTFSFGSRKASWEDSLLVFPCENLDMNISTHPLGTHSRSHALSAAHSVFLSHTQTQTHKLVFQAHSRLDKTWPKQAFTIDLVHYILYGFFFFF